MAHAPIPLGRLLPAWAIAPPVPPAPPRLQPHTPPVVPLGADSEPMAPWRPSALLGE